MKLTYLFMGIFLLALTTGCGGSANAEQSPAEKGASKLVAAEEKLWDEVMEIHDEVMPKMTEINRLSKQLKDAMANNQVAATDTSEVKKVIAALTKADEGMWDWMHNLKQLDRVQAEEANHEDVMKYLRGEKVAMVRVRMDMINSIETAQKMVNYLDLKPQE
jgi:regulator of replication initiation timing